MTRSWLLVSSELVETSGQGMANLALGRYLLGRGDALHVVAHRCAPDVARAARWHRVPRPGRSAFLGERLLARTGRRVARALPGARVVVNGGNCAWGDVSWVHMVHRAWDPSLRDLPLATRARRALARWVDRRREVRIIPSARVVIANSERTRDDLERYLGLSRARVRVVYLGIDSTRFGPVTPDERGAARATLGLSAAEGVVLFVGGLGHDRLKGFDHLLSAWRDVVAERTPATLLVAGGGAVSVWREEARRAGLAASVRFLGEVGHVERLLAASDLLVSPSRYDSYGMNVQEAIARGVLALVSSAAGVSERLGPDLSELVIPPPGEEPPRALAGRILSALRPDPSLLTRYAQLSSRIRARDWEHMARELVEAIEAAPGA